MEIHHSIANPDPEDLVGTASTGAVQSCNQFAPCGPPQGRPSVGTRVFQNTIAQVGGRGINLLLSFATSILLARYLGREGMGKYGALYAYLALYSWLATFCLDHILAREVAVRRSQAAQIFHAGSVIGMAFAVAGTILAALLAPLFGYTGHLRLLILLASVDLLILAPVRLPSIIFQVDMRVWYGVLTGLIRQALWLVAILLLVFRSAAFYEVIVARTLCGVVEAIIIWKLSYRPGFITGPRQLDWTEARNLFRYGYPMALSAVATGVLQRIDQVMLHNMVGDRALGLYVVAVQLTEQFGALPIALVSSLFPILSQTAGQEGLFRQYLGITYRFLMVIAFLVCVAIIPITAPLIRILYGPQYASTATLINVLIWSEVPLFLAIVLINGIVAKNLQKYLPISAVAGAALNIGLNLVFIPRWGALGASWATVISYVVAFVLFYLVFPSTRSMAFQGLRMALPPSAIALPIVLLLSLWPAHFLIKFAAAVLLYTAGVWLIGSVRKAEIDRLRAILRDALDRLGYNTT